MDDAVISALCVAVAPSQAAFFAGEPLTVTITITNTRAPPNTNGAPPVSPNLPPNTPVSSAGSSKSHARSQSAALSSPRQGHKRSSHSVSSVPIAHPPTSPGMGQIRHTPSSSLSGFSPTSAMHPIAEPAKEVRRKGMIGRGACGGKVGNGDAGGGEGAGADGVLDGRRAVFRTVRDVRAPLSSPRISSPLARTTSVPQSHPHARKPSVYDGSLHPSSSSSSVPSTLSTSSSQTTDNGSLESIDESLASSQQVYSFHDQSSTLPSLSQPYSTRYASLSVPHSAPIFNPKPSSPQATPSPEITTFRSTYVRANSAAQTALGHGLPGRPHTAAQSSFQHANGLAAPPADGSELVLYAYVNLTGSMFLVPPQTITTAWSETVKRMRLRRRIRGGGSMDIAAMSPQVADVRAMRHNRRSSLASGIWGLLSPVSPSSPNSHSPVSPGTGNPFQPGHRPRSSTSGSFLSPPLARGVGLGVEGIGYENGDEWDPEAPLNIFEVPNAMLGVDIRLEPGETKSWTYKVNLPDWLPPTYAGRAVKFSYQITVGVCRSILGGSNSRVMKVPVRLYNHVSADNSPLTFDLMDPVKTGVASLVDGVGKVPYLSPPSSPLQHRENDSLSTLRDYAAQLLDPDISYGLISAGIEPDREGTHTLTGCREAVEILTRLPRRVSYDIHKDGEKVAVLTFTKAAWRLGETVQGVVDVNFRGSRTRVLKISTFLESRESLPGPLAIPIVSAADARAQCRVYAEHHASLLSCTSRTTFTLDIPSDAAPAFSLVLKQNVGQANGSARPSQSGGGVDWFVRVCLLVCVAPQGAQLQGLRRIGERGEWGSSYEPLPGPLCRRPPPPPAPPPSVRTSTDSTSSGSWAGWLTSALFSPSEPRYHDGDLDEPEDAKQYSDPSTELDDEEDEEGWEEMRTELVECEVPVRVWPGNTAFRASDVVFDV